MSLHTALTGYSSRINLHRALWCCAMLSAPVLLSATALSAQPRATADGPGQTITINPIYLLAGWVSGEYEQRVNPSLSAGGGVNYFEYGDSHYTIIEAKGTLYPNEHAMRGFGISGSLGIAHISFAPSGEDVRSDPIHPCGVGVNCATGRKSASAPTLGIALSYQWLLGRTGRTSVVVGIGGERFLASKSTLTGTDRVTPTFRMGIGYAW